MAGPRRGQEHASARAGRYASQPGGFAAFIPASYPPADIRLEGELLQRLTSANLELGKLVGAADVLPNPDLFVTMYVRREAVLSSQIEGTVASLMDVLEYEAMRKTAEKTVDLREVTNYVAALRGGLSRVRSIPVSLRLIREIHASLMRKVRGGEPSKTPGEFRRSQNWLGGASPASAAFVPPPVPDMHRALDEFEKSLHPPIAGRYPELVTVGLAHAQFETIHPFLDGNGRMGRLLVTFLLCEYGILNEPLLYLSIHFKKNREEYYARLQAVRDHGDWEGWLEFFLGGVAAVAKEAAETSRKIVRMREEMRETLPGKLGRRSGNGLRLLDHLFRDPIVTVKGVEDVLALSQPAALKLVNVLVDAGILVELTGRQRNRVYEFHDYLKLFRERQERGD